MKHKWLVDLIMFLCIIRMTIVGTSPDIAADEAIRIAHYAANFVCLVLMLFYTLGTSIYKIITENKMNILKKNIGKLTSGVFCVLLILCGYEDVVDISAYLSLAGTVIDENIKV